MRAPLDQHFLTDSKTVDRIASVVDVSGSRVLEIGPGRGILTSALLARGAILTVIEIDGRLAAQLESRFSEEISSGRLNVINADATKVEFPDFDYAISNLPYSASSKITFRILEKDFIAAVLMYQKEFAQRMIALPGTPACGRLSIMVQTYARVKPMMEVPPESFSPPPEVWSWVVKITPIEPPCRIDDHHTYAEVVKTLFSARRKTVRNGLKGAAGVFGKERIKNAIECLPDEVLSARPEELALCDFAEISNVI